MTNDRAARRRGRPSCRRRRRDELAAGFDPSAGSSAVRLRGAAAAVASERSGVDLAVESATARAAALAGAYATVLAATRAGDLDRAREWLLVREFKPVTRFAHPSAAASVAIASLADGVVPRARAVRSIRGDLLDTYEALLRRPSPTPATRSVPGSPRRRRARRRRLAGYWWILRDAFMASAERRCDAARSRLRAPRRRRPDGEPAATARGGSDDRGRPARVPRGAVSAPEQARRAGQLDPLPRARARRVRTGSRERPAVVPIEIQEAIAFRAGAATAFGDLQSYPAARDLAGDARRAERARLTPSTWPGDAHARDRGRRLRRTSRRSRRPRRTRPPRRRLSRRLEGGHGGGRLRRHRDPSPQGDPPSLPPATCGARSRAELEAYATFELGPEQRLRGLAPVAVPAGRRALLVRRRTGTHRVAQLLRQNATADELAETLAALDLALKESAEAIGERPAARAPRSSRTARSSCSAKGLEAVLILAALMASMVGVAAPASASRCMAGVGIALVGERRDLGRSRRPCSARSHGWARSSRRSSR